MATTFETLMTEFCQAIGLRDTADIAAIIAGEPLDIDGVAVSVRHAEGIAPDRVSVYCDFGIPPEAQRAKLYRQVLEVNLAGYELDLGVFGASPDSGRLILATRFRLGTMTVESLRDVLAHLVARGKAFGMAYRRPDHTAVAGPARRGLGAPASLPRR